MSFLTRWFGRRSSDAAAVPESPPEFYKGFTIRAAPFRSEGRYQTAGIIEKEIDGLRREHRFIRADAYPSYEDAVAFSLTKARQIIDLEGERLFDR
jgi:hypothetical protein